MRSYEVALVLKPNVEEEKCENLFGKVTSLVEEAGGAMGGITRLGKRRLAYEVKDCRDGNYSILKFQGGHKVPAEVDRVLRLSEEVLRHLITREEV